MPDIQLLGRTTGSYRNAAFYECVAAIPTGQRHIISIDNTGLSTYNNVYFGAAYVYVPSHQGRYPIHVACESLLGTARFVGVEVQSATATTFRFNWISGTLSQITAPPDTATDGQTYLFDQWHKIAWYANTSGPGDTFFVNNVQRAISGVPNKNWTFVMNNHFLMCGGTPVGFRLGMAVVSIDPAITAVNAPELFARYPYRAPIYLGPGTQTQAGYKRVLYCENGTQLLTEHGTGKVFAFTNPGDTTTYYVQRIGEVKI